MRRIPVSAVCLVMVAACGSPKGTYLSPDELAAREGRSAAPVSMADMPPGAAAREPSRPSSPERVGTTSDDYVTKKRGFDTRQREITRRREDLSVDRADHADRVARTRLEHQSAQAKEALARARAQHAVNNASAELADFREVVRERRLRQDALELTAAHDRLLETREELAQLELMYGDDELGDATAEIVLQRTRRRLARAEEQHRLTQMQSAELRERTLPREEQDLVVALEAAEVELANADRAAAAGEHARAVERRELDRKALALDREESDIHREEQELQGDLRRWEQSLS